MVSEGDLMRPFAEINELRRAWWLSLLSEGSELAPEFSDYVRRDRLQAQNLMTAPVITAVESTTLSQLSELMTSHRIKRVPIVRSERGGWLSFHPLRSLGAMALGLVGKDRIDGRLRRPPALNELRNLRRRVTSTGCIGPTSIFDASILFAHQRFIRRFRAPRFSVRWESFPKASPARKSNRSEWTRTP